MYKALKSTPVKTFSLMFSIMFLLNLNYTILKSVRKTLAIADLGGSASSIPFFELFGTLPGALLMAWLLTKLNQRFCIKKVFFVTLVLFISFFLVFAGIIYPKLLTLAKNDTTILIYKFSSLIFYVVGELWKPALIQILFLGFLNLNLNVDEAKKIYPSLMLGASIGAIIAGPITIFCNSNFLFSHAPLAAQKWTHSLLIMMFAISIIGLLTFALFSLLSNHYKSNEKNYENERGFGLLDAFKQFFSSTKLKLIGWIVLADYIAYSLSEVLFFAILKQKYPLPSDYCSFLGYLSFTHSALTLFLAVIVAPYVFRRFSWVTCATILPFGLLIMEGAFFFVLCSKTPLLTLLNLSESSYITLLVIIGSTLFCVCRAVKYTIFDPCKEISFVAMPVESQLKGKLIVDGVCAKVGRGASSALSISFISISGGLLASAYLSAITAIAIIFTLILSTSKLGVDSKQTT